MSVCKVCCMAWKFTSRQTRGLMLFYSSPLQLWPTLQFVSRHSEPRWGCPAAGWETWTYGSMSAIFCLLKSANREEAEWQKVRHMEQASCRDTVCVYVCTICWQSSSFLSTHINIWLLVPLCVLVSIRVSACCRWTSRDKAWKQSDTSRLVPNVAADQTHPGSFLQMLVCNQLYLHPILSYFKVNPFGFSQAEPNCLQHKSLSCCLRGTKEVCCLSRLCGQRVVCANVTWWRERKHVFVESQSYN